MKKLLVGIISIFIGIILLFFGFLSTQDGDYIQTRAVVINNIQDGEMYTPILQYEVDGITYEEEGIPDELDSILGSEVIINYDPDNPAEFTIGNSNNPMIFYIIGALFILIGICLLFRAMKNINSVSIKINSSSPTLLGEIPDDFKKNVVRDGNVTKTIKSNKPLTEEEINRIEQRIEELKNMPESENVRRVTKTYRSDKPLSQEQINDLKEEFGFNNISNRDDLMYTYTETRKLTDEELKERETKF